MCCEDSSPDSPIVPVVSTNPGLIEMTTKSSFLSFKAHFVVIMRAAAFVAPYAAISAIPVIRTIFGSAPPVPTTTIFFKGAVEARSSGRNAEILWMTPSALTLYYVADIGQIQETVT